jgi:hypothetical protein
MSGRLMPGGWASNIARYESHVVPGRLLGVGCVVLASRNGPSGGKDGAQLRYVAFSIANPAVMLEPAELEGSRWVL